MKWFVLQHVLVKHAYELVLMFIIIEVSQKVKTKLVTCVHVKICGVVKQRVREHHCEDKNNDLTSREVWQLLSNERFRKHLVIGQRCVLRCRVILCLSNIILYRFCWRERRQLFDVLSFMMKSKSSLQFFSWSNLVIFIASNLVENSGNGSTES